jgi:uroporphyrinogen-III decarboxylase
MIAVKKTTAKTHKHTVMRFNQTELTAGFTTINHDMLIEAEALGCGIKWDVKNQPVLTSHSLAEGFSPINLKIPCPADGRIMQVISDISAVSKNHPERDPFTTITGPFSLAYQLIGHDFFNQININPKYIENVLAYSSAVGEAMATMYIKAGCTGFSILDPLAGQLESALFEKFVTPFVQPLIDYIHDQSCFCSMNY